MSDDNEPSLLSTSSTPIDPLWYPNSGVSHHITIHIKKFSKKTPFTHNDVVCVGNGPGMHIHHIRSTTFIPPHTSRPLNLNQLLHVLSVTKNLMNVFKFVKDNQVFF